MENEKKRNIILVAILAIVIIATVIVGFLVFNSFFNNNIDPGKNTEPETVTITEKDDSYKYAKNPIDFKSLHKTNKEIFGWIKVPGTNVDHPLLQSQDKARGRKGSRIPVDGLIVVHRHVRLVVHRIVGCRRVCHWIQSA